MKKKIRKGRGGGGKPDYKASFFYYLNPKNVSSAIALYGYTYSVKNTILVFLAVIAIACGLGILFRLSAGYIAVIALVGMACVPKVIINSYQNMYEQKRFSDVNIYIKQLLYSFRKNPIILTALQDAAKAIPNDSPMREVIDKAVNHILYDYAEHASEEAFRMIEEAYPCPRVRDAHRLLLKVKENGGDYMNATRILLMNRSQWERDTCVNQKQCKAKQRIVEVAIALVCGVTTFTPLLFNFTMKQMDFTGNVLYKVGTTVMLILCIIIFTKTDKLATINWLKNESEMTPEEQINLYEKVEYYDEKKERRKSYLWAAIPSAVFFICFFLQKKLFMALMIPLILFMLNQHRISHDLAKKRLTTEINKAFPQWLMELSLLLQTTPNVHAALQKSLQEAPPVLVPALTKLLQEIEENPESNEPYSNFLSKYNYIDVSSAMGMLYSISNGGGGDSDEQIEEILETNVALLKQMEDIINEKRLTAIQAQITMPAVAGMFKLGTDLILITVGFMSMRFY